MKTKIVVILLSSLLICACGRAPASRPEDFSIKFEWDTGALPPQYHYSFTIAVGSGLSGEFFYQPGYGDEASADLWQTGFDMKSKDLDALYQFLLDEGMLRSEWATGQPLLGGQGTSLVITTSGKTYQIPSVSGLTQPERSKVEAFIELLRGIVPQSIWDEMDARQEDFEAKFKE